MRLREVLALIAYFILFGVKCIAYKSLSDHEIKRLLENDHMETLLDIENDQGLIKPLLKPRIPGSKGHTEVENFIIDTVNSLEGPWELEIDSFEADTPIQPKVPFTNIIATRDPPNFIPGQSQRLVLAAHYDSKRLPKGFIGAIDSGVPCAILLYLMKSLDEQLTKSWKSHSFASPKSDTGLRIIFFDGEEAFDEWTDEDSIYGARHLAEKWHFARTSKSNEIKSISVLVLMDLLGSSSPDIRPYFEETRDLHSKLRIIDKRITGSNLSKLEKRRTFFPSMNFNILISDDHIPFLARNVPILHLIPATFPPQWHEPTDTAENLDQNTIYELSLIFKIFVAEFLELFKSETKMKSEL